MQTSLRPSRALCSRSQGRPLLSGTRRGEYTQTHTCACGTCARGSGCFTDSRLLGVDSPPPRTPRADHCRWPMPQTQPRNACSEYRGETKGRHARGAVRAHGEGSWGLADKRARELLKTEAEAFGVAASCPVATVTAPVTTAPGSSAAPGSKRKRCRLMK